MIFEQKWFQWSVIGLSLTLTASVAVFFMFQEVQRQQELEEQREALIEQREAYRNQFRTTMVRVYQNLQLEHFLAAYRNFESLPSPEGRLDRTALRDYEEALFRVGLGLLKNEFLEESEAVFEELKNSQEHGEDARARLAEVASLRRIEFGTRALEEGKALLEEERYRAALNELVRARQEYDAAELFDIHDLTTERERLAPLLREARHHVHLEDSEFHLSEAEMFVSLKEFDEAMQELGKASEHLARAAFYDETSKDIEEIQRRIRNLDAEIGFQVPNQQSIWNANSSSESSETGFYLSDYEFSPPQRENDRVKIGLSYVMEVPENEYFIVRYRIHFFNGLSFFNGHFLTEKEKEDGEVLFDQELPEDFKHQAAQRIDLKVYNSEEELVSEVSRAFRQPS